MLRIVDCPLDSLDWCVWFSSGGDREEIRYKFSITPGVSGLGREVLDGRSACSGEKALGKCREQLLPDANRLTDLIGKL